MNWQIVGSAATGYEPRGRLQEPFAVVFVSVSDESKLTAVIKAIEGALTKPEGDEMSEMERCRWCRKQYEAQGMGRHKASCPKSPWLRKGVSKGRPAEGGFSDEEREAVKRGADALRERVERLPVRSRGRLGATADRRAIRLLESLTKER
jgi:hypothetical protein